jgi:hypothetical protein
MYVEYCTIAGTSRSHHKQIVVVVFIEPRQSLYIDILVTQFQLTIKLMLFSPEDARMLVLPQISATNTDDSI